MEIKRKVEIFFETRRQFVIHQPETIEQIFCLECGEPMLAAEQAAEFFGTTRRQIYRYIETGGPHFLEAAAGAVMICIFSLAAIIDAAANQNKPNEKLKD